MSQVYMTAKLNLADGTILYPQVSLDNIVASISDPTLVSVATTTNGKVPIAQLPTTLIVTDSNTTVPTAGAVYGALNTKQNTLVEGDNIIHIIGGSTIMADITNLDVAGIDQTVTNGVHLVLGGGNTISAAATFVTGETAGVLAGVGDGIALDNGVISAAIGSGLKIGAGTDAGKVVINNASVETTLQDVRIDGASTVTPVNDQVVTPGNLRGALSVGQAVDVSCQPYNNSGSIVYVNDDFLQGFTATMVNGTKVGFYDTTSHRFPKFADNLVYLFIADVSGSGTVTPNGASAVILSGTPQRIWVKVTASNSGYISASANATMTVINWRQYEVTALTDEAIAYIAQLPDPDAFFRSASVYSLRNKYLVKQDMICPFIPTISMPDNSDLTVATGLSYKIRYTNDNPHTITADTIPSDGYGWDTHIQMFIKGTSSIVFQQPLILMDALTPNAGHNLVVKFRNGDALVYVEDTSAGNIVVAATGTTAGTLNYFLQQDPGSGQANYIIFAPATDGLTCDAGTVSVVYNTDILGNGTDKTAITGTYTVASGKTMNLQDLTVSGSTFGGAGTINLDATSIVSDTEVISGGTVNFSGTNTLDATLSGAGDVAFKGTVGVGTGGSGVLANNSSRRNMITGDVEFNNIIITGCSVASYAGISFGQTNAKDFDVRLTDCIITGNTNTDNRNGAALCVGASPSGGAANGYGSLVLRGSTVSSDNAGGSPILLATHKESYFIDSLIETSITHYNYGDNPPVTHLTISGSTLTGYQFMHFKNTLTTLSGRNVWNSQYATSHAGAAHIISGSTVDFTGGIGNNSLRLYFDAGITVGDVNTQNEWIPGGSFSFITVTGTQGTLSGCSFNQLFYDGRVSANTNITLASMVLWEAENATFESPLDASAAYTVKLSGTTFTSASKTLNASRIQLPAGTTVSLSGNTNADNTKILEAPVIVVGDNAAAPSGSATVVNAAGTESTISGIGTYIDKEGDNDFVPLTSVSTVSTSVTSGAGSLPVALTGSNKFVRLTSSVVGTVGEATDAVDKTVMTNEYELIIGGTFSLTSATADEATKTVAIQSGGTMSVVDIRGGKDSVIDLGGTHVSVASNTTAYASGCTFTSGSTDYGGAFTIANGGQIDLSACSLTRNTATSRGVVLGSGLVNMTSCTITSNTVLDTYESLLLAAGGARITNCTISDNTAYVAVSVASNSFVSNTTISGNGRFDLVPSGANATLDGSTVGIIGMRNNGTLALAGNNAIGKIEKYNASNSGTVTISSGAILDLTGNVNSVPIAPGGGITFEPGGATVYPSAGQSSAYVLGGITVPQIGNTNVVTASGSDVINSGGVDGIISGATIDVATNSNILYAYGTLTIKNGGVSGRLFPTNYNVTRSGTVILEGAVNITSIGYNVSQGLTPKGTVIISSGANVTLGNNIQTSEGGIQVVGGTCTVNGFVIESGTYTRINSDGTTE